MINSQDDALRKRKSNSGDLSIVMFKEKSKRKNLFVFLVILLCVQNIRILGNITKELKILLIDRFEAIKTDTKNANYFKIEKDSKVAKEKVN